MYSWWDILLYYLVFSRKPIFYFCKKKNIKKGMLMDKNISSKARIRLKKHNS